MKIYSALAKRAIEVPDARELRLSGLTQSLAEEMAARIKSAMNDDGGKQEREAMVVELLRVSDELQRANAALAEATLRAEASDRARAQAETVLAQKMAQAVTVSAPQSDDKRLDALQASIENALADLAKSESNEAAALARLTDAINGMRIKQAVVPERKGYTIRVGARDGNGDISTVKLIPE